MRTKFKVWKASILNLKVPGARKLVRSKFYPLHRKGGVAHKYSVFIGIGGNIGDTRARFERFLAGLMRDRRFFVVETSPILLNAAFGYEAQADFLNAVILARTSLSAEQTLKIMQRDELRFGRTRPFKNAPRTLDLDILYYGRKVRASKRLRVPHEGANKRISVILPLGMMKEI